MNIYTQTLIDKANELDVYDISAFVLGDRRFDIWSGSSKPTQHHYGKNGLSTHTWEVVELCFVNDKTLVLHLDPIELFLSALFHDCGKMWDYQPDGPDYKEWCGTEHKRLIHHISRSALLWNSACTQHNFKYGKYADKVTHNILAHHGLRAWGSPVMPKTKTAWLLHLCDGISARMNDADKYDFVKN